MISIFVSTAILSIAFDKGSPIIFVLHMNHNTVQYSMIVFQTQMTVFKMLTFRSHLTVSWKAKNQVWVCLIILTHQGLPSVFRLFFFSFLIYWGFILGYPFLTKDLKQKIILNIDFITENTLWSAELALHCILSLL